MDQPARTPRQIGAALKRRRKLLGMSQDKLGTRVRLRQATISKLEAGDPGTKLSTLLDTLAGLGLELVIRERSSGQPDIEDLF
ncbi:helix-turn-helix domain-containing protein [Mesorhizobium sp. CAU 1741]|uniref:helix-turn-helix domain-containing protein n=1 Tax=Mesorhizobium sp. CAU 1741 TaxID=3140366 RepID=UPI00325BA1EB